MTLWLGFSKHLLNKNREDPERKLTSADEFWELSDGFPCSLFRPLSPLVRGQWGLLTQGPRCLCHRQGHVHPLPWPKGRPSEGPVTRRLFLGTLCPPSQQLPRNNGDPDHLRSLRGSSHRPAAWPLDPEPPQPWTTSSSLTAASVRAALQTCVHARQLASLPASQTMFNALHASGPWSFPGPTLHRSPSDHSRSLLSVQVSDESSFLFHNLSFRLVLLGSRVLLVLLSSSLV